MVVHDRRIAGLLTFDFVVHVRKAHIPTLREAAFQAIQESTHTAERFLPGRTQRQHAVLFGNHRAGRRPRRSVGDS
jgi:hypothetical protein